MSKLAFGEAEFLIRLSCAGLGVHIENCPPTYGVLVVRLTRDQNVGSHAALYGCSDWPSQPGNQGCLAFKQLDLISMHIHGESARFLRCSARSARNPHKFHERGPKQDRVAWRRSTLGSRVEITSRRSPRGRAAHPLTCISLWVTHYFTRRTHDYGLASTSFSSVSSKSLGFAREHL